MLFSVTKIVIHHISYTYNTDSYVLYNPPAPPTISFVDDPCVSGDFGYHNLSAAFCKNDKHLKELYTSLFRSKRNFSNENHTNVYVYSNILHFAHINRSQVLINRYRPLRCGHISKFSQKFVAFFLHFFQFFGRNTFFEH